MADPNAQTGTAAPAPVQRLLYLWQDGFSVDDGPLYRYDDPANAATLAMINTGRAPLDILNVQHNQEVDLKVVERRKEKYVTPKKKYVPFSGSGQRLGSPVPGVGDAEAASATIAARMTTTTTTTATPTADAPPSTSSDASAAADAWQPTVLVQVRLSDGSRLQSRFNTTQSIGDLYRFVDRSRPCSSAYILMTTFPNKDQTDKTLLLGDTAELKRGGVVIQKLV